MADGSGNGKGGKVGACVLIIFVLLMMASCSSMCSGSSSSEHSVTHESGSGKYGTYNIDGKQVWIGV